MSFCTSSGGGREDEDRLCGFRALLNWLVVLKLEADLFRILLPLSKTSFLVMLGVVISGWFSVVMFISLSICFITSLIRGGMIRFVLVLLVFVIVVMWR